MEMHDPRGGFVFSTDDDPQQIAPKEEVKVAKAAQAATTMITTSGISTSTGATPAVEPQMVSSRVGTNNPAFSRMPLEAKHMIIAQQMNAQFADKIEQAEVNTSSVNKPLRGALFGQTGASRQNYEAEKAHKYFNRIDTSHLM